MAYGLENVPHEEGRQDHGPKVSSTQFLEGNKKKKRKTVTGDKKQPTQAACHQLALMNRAGLFLLACHRPLKHQPLSTLFVACGVPLTRASSPA